jgi:hypothetical protein
MFCVPCGQSIGQEEFETDLAHADSPKTHLAVKETSSRRGSSAPSIFNLTSETGNAAGHVEPLTFSSAGAQPEPSPVRRAPRYVPVRKNSFPIIEFLVAVLLVAGAVAAIWIFRSTIRKQDLTESPSISVTIAPASAKLRAGKSAEFSATVSGSGDNEVIWSLQENDIGGSVVPKGAKAEDGKVLSVAVYTAPRKAGIYHLRVSSKSHPESSATALITVRK